MSRAATFERYSFFRERGPYKIKRMLEQAVSRVLFSRAVTRLGTMAIHLASVLPPRSSDLPGNSGGPPSNVPLFGLAPGGVCRAPVVTDGTGELLPHLFTLTFPIGSRPVGKAVYFLWHFPSRYRDWVLPSTLPCGVRTFLCSIQVPQR